MESKINGLITQLLNGEQWLSFSSLKNFRGSPKDFIDYKFRKVEQTPAMLYGQMVHCLVLEPDDFSKRYFALEDEDICNQIGGAKPRATNKYKEWYQATIAEAGEKTIVDTDSYLHAKVIAGNVLHNRASKKVVNMTDKREFPIEWEFMNFKFKGFIDGMGEKAIFDLKTCPDATPSKFQRQIINDGYYLQAAMYLYATNVELDYFIIAVDKQGGISVHQLDEKLIKFGLDEYKYLLDNFNECILKDGFNQSYDFWSERWDGIYTATKY